MDQLADTVDVVYNFFGLKHVIGLGVGAGANILARFAVSSGMAELCWPVPTCEAGVEMLFRYSPPQWTARTLEADYLCSVMTISHFSA